MKISVVVPAFNEEKLIARTLANIDLSRAAFDRIGWQSEVIVCDNNSTDRTAEMARATGATVVFEPINQISRSRNRGASSATGDWLVFIDADSLATPELFADVAEVIHAGKCVGGGSTVKVDDAQGLIRWVVWAWNGISRLKRWMAGSFVFCEAHVFRELGGFSEKLFAAEELEFSERLKKWAHDENRDVIILYRHPLLTSGRKVHLYSGWEYFRMLFRTVWERGKNLADTGGLSDVVRREAIESEIYAVELAMSSLHTPRSGNGQNANGRLGVRGMFDGVERLLVHGDVISTQSSISDTSAKRCLMSRVQ